MKNFEVPLYLVADEESGYVDIQAITEAPDLQVITAQRLFTELEGLTWEERRELINTNCHVERLPKCLDIPLAVAGGGDIDRARWLLNDMIDIGILHEPSSEHRKFFERADMKEEAFEQVAEAEAENRREEVIRNLRRDN